MTKSKDLIPGTLDMLVLKTLSHGERHGYGIAQRIHQVSDEILRVEEGSLYPALHRMERKGWIRASWGLSEANRRAKYYSLTASGRRRLAEEQATWDRMATAIARVLEAGAEA